MISTAMVGLISCVGLTRVSNRLFLSEGRKNFRAIPVGTGPGKFNVTDVILQETGDGCVKTWVLDLNRTAEMTCSWCPPDRHGCDWHLNLPRQFADHYVPFKWRRLVHRQVVRDAATQQALSLNRSYGVKEVGRLAHIPWI